ncbi:MAG: FtsX-like permease family protein [Candidatus Eisenbacteria bacterium]|nr:FtsX-like permease family protein [Candidatus Eisenbacteria bacterium]
MRGSLTNRYAMRSLRRNLRRTLLSIIGVAIGIAVALFMAALMRGSDELRVRSIVASGFGHMRIAHAEWEQSRDPDLRLENWRAERDTALALPEVEVAAPRARKTALLAFGTRVVGAELLGVDPVAELRFNRIAQAVDEGRYLEAGEEGAVVVGATITEHLDVELHDDLYLTVVGRDGQMQYAMLRIVGIVRTGSREMDAGVSHVDLGEFMRITGYEGAGEITVVLEDPDEIPEVAEALAARLPEGDVVLPWQVVLPTQGADAQNDAGFMGMIIVIVMLVVTLGIASARMTAILERKREFAVLLALGMKGRQVVGLVFLESVATGALGAALGLLLVTPLVHYTTTEGIDFGALMGGDFHIEGVLIDPVIYSDMGLWMIPQALGIGLLATFLASLYPAWLAVRTDPRSALSLREG